MNRGGFAPGSDVVTVAHHLGGWLHAPPPPPGILFFKFYFDIKYNGTVREKLKAAIFYLTLVILQLGT